jgi:hypothetical protein
MESRNQLLMGIVIFAVLARVPMSVAHASITGDFEMGKDVCKAHANNDFSNYYDDSCPGDSTLYCSGYVIGYGSEWVNLEQQLQ